jgi:hypothetical protein
MLNFGITKLIIIMVRIKVTPVYRKEGIGIYIAATEKVVRVFGIPVYKKTITHPERGVEEGYFHPSI